MVLGAHGIGSFPSFLFLDGLVGYRVFDPARHTSGNLVKPFKIKGF